MKILESYIRTVDSFNRRVGRFAMYLIFALMGVLLWSSVTKFAGSPALWTLELAQFIMVGYYLLGGGYSMQLGDHVRMDLIYGNWSPRRKAAVDAVTVLFLLFYLCVLLYGGISSTTYAIEWGERAHSVWRPYMWPVKLVATIGVFLMLLQALAEFFRDILFLRGVSVNHASEAGL
ncbi:MAG: TRAP transporter small permease subunit [Hoeflea sp.]|jgi:TRAP-type mannitol/chloroaromatic compound transport system permease small subunit|uniref:TRAP transporter small permease subunit n=1 Tax=Hoeflea sp. TaxID=1940281 RepID=UPI0032EDAE88